jgi:hypothetical protein
MGNKIIIDEEVLAKLDFLAENVESSIERECIIKIQKLILENSATISIDESIEDRAKKLYPVVHPDFISAFIDSNESCREAYKLGATEQSIISEIKSKEKEPNKCTKD